MKKFALAFICGLLSALLVCSLVCNLYLMSYNKHLQIRNENQRAIIEQIENYHPGGRQ